MIVGTFRILPSPNRRDEVLEVLRSIKGPVQAQPGCETFEIYGEETPQKMVLLIERWASEALLDAHIRSEAFRRILGALELAASPPEVRFESVSASRGMELIERSRNSPSPSGEQERT